jgi:hypothetical protein
VIYIGGMYGGPELRGSKLDQAIAKLVRLRGEGAEGEAGSLDIVFHVPGSVFAPEFSGLRTGRLSKKERMLAIQVSVPQHIVSAQEREIETFLVQALREAIDLAVPAFRKAEIPYPHAEYVALLEQIGQGLVH